MGNLLHAERYKLFHDKIFWITLVVIVAFNMIVVSGSTIFSMSGHNALSEIMKKEILTILISCIYGGLFIGDDFAERTLYHALMAGKSRVSVLLAKAGSFLIAIDIILFIFPLLLVMICTVRNGWGIALSAGVILHFAGLIVALLILGFSIGALSLLAAVCFRDVGRTIGIPIILNFITILLLNGPYATALAHILPAGTLILMVNGTMSPAKGIIVGLIWSTFLFIASALIFKRAELR
ncbi:hypothetical protein ACFQ3W_10435 [Paenibacillus puldeungensis]|uniref:ABC transporter permease n=1 Tax=Paenibacillus puldeungensis TaxID=696536 RepID=A0ABW3RX17_9BACL